MTRTLARRQRERLSQPDRTAAMLEDLAASATSVEAMAEVIKDVMRDGVMPVEVAAAMVPDLERIMGAAGDLARLLRPATLVGEAQ